MDFWRKEARFCCTIVLATVFMPSVSHAMSGMGTVCNDEQNEIEAVTCLQSALEHANAAMALKYSDIQSRVLNGNHKLVTRLAGSQSAWKDYVRKTCDEFIKPATRDQPIGDSDVLSCKVELTIERTKDLDRMFYVPLHD